MAVKGEKRKKHENVFSFFLISILGFHSFQSNAQIIIYIKKNKKQKTWLCCAIEFHFNSTISLIRLWVRLLTMTAL